LRRTSHERREQEWEGGSDKEDGEEPEEDQRLLLDVVHQPCERAGCHPVLIFPNHLLASRQRLATTDVYNTEEDVSEMS
jgi:hypothetical protein